MLTFRVPALPGLILVLCGPSCEPTHADPSAEAVSSSHQAQESSRRTGRTALTPLADAHRLLTQATFGPTADELERVQRLGVHAWLATQLQAPSAYDDLSDAHASHLQRMIELAERAEPSVSWWSGGIFNREGAGQRTSDYQFAAWLDHALGASEPGREAIGSDQLRQRVAYAWSQLFVAAPPQGFDSRAECVAAYADLLARHALGNYRELLRAVATSGAMGISLSHQGNRKYDPVTGARPDENFAREIMQLFSVGLHQLNQDGSPDRDGDPRTWPDPGTGLVPSYTQADVEELAKVFTGWDLARNSHYGDLKKRGADLTVPMEFHPQYHEDEFAEGGDGLVTVLGVSFPLAAGSDGSGLDAAIDVLVDHQNTGPFVARHLITQLVTANPPGDYVARVAAVFEDDGSGQRGDLAALVYAILTDPVARGALHAEDPHAGLAKEPFLVFAQTVRAMGVRALDGWIGVDGIPVHGTYWFPNAVQMLGQMPMRAPSVFNFFDADHVPADEEFIAHDLLAPSLQIQTGNALIELDELISVLFSKFERVRIEEVIGQDLAVFAAQQDADDRFLFLLDLSRELEVIELALDGDGNGDFANFGSRPDEERAARALIDHYDDLLFGARLDASSRRALRHYLLEGAAIADEASSPVDQARRMAHEGLRLLVFSPAFHTR